VDKRTRARELAIQGLYQLDIQGSDLLESLAVCDELIAASAIKWQMSRLSTVDKSILRLAVYQLKFCDDIPPRVVINEAIELAKKFSADKSSAFVNGVLDAVLRKLRTEND
jgi:N utilization substance protein B